MIRRENHSEWTRQRRRHFVRFDVT